MLKVGRLTYMLKTKDKNRNTKCTRNPSFDTLYSPHMLSIWNWFFWLGLKFCLHST